MLNREELIRRVAVAKGVTQKVATGDVDVVLNEIVGAVQDHEEVSIAGVLHIGFKYMPERQRRNPQTQEIVTVSANEKLTVKLGSRLTKAVK